MNLADSSTLRVAMITRGYQLVDDEKDADLIVLNTCSVRQKAEDRIRGRLGEIHSLKKRKPHVKIAVVGCMAQRLGNELIDQVPYVDYVLGTDRLFALPDVLEGNENTSSVMTAFGHENIDSIKPIRENEHSAFVTISRGCNNYCSYCIVPYVRGRERSHSREHIVEAVHRMNDEGVVEITLLGQNVNSYRYKQTDFPCLLQSIVRETDIRRIRFMTSHPKDLSEKLVDVMANEPRIMPHIHLPLQSGSDAVLQRMGRAYTYSHYRHVIDYIRRKLDYVVITTDLMVGFPGETLEDFEKTLEAVRDIRYDSAFMFRYSVRPGTKAAGYDDDVPEDEKIRRLNKLIELQQNISYERNQREVGRVCECVVEGYSRRSQELARGRTEGNKTVLFRTDEMVLGSVAPVQITAADAFTLRGEIMEANRS
ncbi:MAG: tRNA (N6-isopentenyl adenosine(37)-C2)-methylthiotransferase MiaB [Candidatus Zixiibacteriota bacterium]|nr:MAG: tRNA (N6-isopentenyl adenosine(37)-C2)-methylthiotransferase MiaB [candidate division Zixibacteria bacterium]